MQLYERGNTYWCRFTYDGKQVRRPTGERTKQAAMARAIEIYNELRDEARAAAKPPPPPSLQTFTEEYFLCWVSETGRLKEKSRKCYRYGAQMLKRQAVYSMRLDRITSEDIDMIQIAGSPSTHNCALRTLRRIFNIAMSKGHLARVPKIALLQERGRKKLIEPATEMLIAEVFSRKRKRAGSLSTALYVILDCGMRPMEIAQMAIADVNFQAGMISIPRSKSAAGERQLPMTDRVKMKLFAKIGARSEGWVFPSPRYAGQSIRPESLTQAWRKAADEAGLARDINLYCARHTYATDVMKATRNAFLVMKALGHTELSTTARYQHHDLDGVGELMNERNRARALVN
jgi:integrase